MSATQVMPFPSLDHAVELCARQARYVSEGAAILRAALGGPDTLDAQAVRLAHVHQRAEEVTRQIMGLVRRVSTRPGERAAIVRLTHALEGELDGVDAALTRMLLFRLPTPSPLAATLVALLIRQAEALERALGLLRQGGPRQAVVGHLVIAGGLAAEADGLLVEGLAALGGDALDLGGMVNWLKWSEVHRPLGSAARRARDAAEAIETLTPPAG